MSRNHWIIEGLVLNLTFPETGSAAAPVVESGWQSTRVDVSKQDFKIFCSIHELRVLAKRWRNRYNTRNPPC